MVDLGDYQVPSSQPVSNCALNEFFILIKQIRGRKGITSFSFKVYRKETLKHSFMYKK